MNPDISRYTKSETISFTFIGTVEGDAADRLLSAIEGCMVGLNLEPDQGWAWVQDGSVIEGNAVELVIDRIGSVLHRTDLLDGPTKTRLASEFANALSGTIPNFDPATFTNAIGAEDPKG
jgi:hypothetical protein